MKSKGIALTLIIFSAASFCFAQTNSEIVTTQVSTNTSIVTTQETISSSTVDIQTTTETQSGQIDLVVGGGFIISSGYQDFTDDAYPSTLYSDEGGYGWLDLYVGLEYKMNNQFSLLGGCDLWLNAADVSGVLDESYVNTIMIPSLYAQLYLGKARMFYVNGGILFPIPDSGSDFYDFEDDGIGFGGNIGVALADGSIRLEGGYTYIPVTAEVASGHPFFPAGMSDDYNFGGLQVRLLLAF